MAKNQVANREQARPIDIFKAKIDKAQDTIVAMLPPHVKAQKEKFFAMIVQAVANDEKLLGCSPNSLLKATIEAADLGLSLNKNLKEGDILPVWSPDGTVAQFRPRYMGLMKLAKQSGEVKDIWAKVVYEKDTFEYDEGVDRILAHKPFRAPTVREFLRQKLGRDALTNEVVAYHKDKDLQAEYAEACDKGELIYGYCVWILPDGTKAFEVMDREKVHKSRAKSEGYKAFTAGKIKSTPWVTDEEEMWRKTAVRLASKYMPMSSDKFRAAVSLDEQREVGENVTVDHATGEVVSEPESVDITAAPSDAAKSQVQKLAERLQPPAATEDTPVTARKSATPKAENGEVMKNRVTGKPMQPVQEATETTVDPVESDIADYEAWADEALAALQSLNPRGVTDWRRQNDAALRDAEFNSPTAYQRVKDAMDGPG